MKYLAQATGGRAFSGGKVVGVQGRDAVAGTSWARYEIHRDRDAIAEAIRFAVDDSRYAYVIGFYVPEPELDGRVHKLSVSIPSRPKLELRYRSGYTAWAGAVTASPAAQSR